MEPIIGKQYGDIVGYRLTSGLVIDCKDGLIGINPQLKVSDGVRWHAAFAPREEKGSSGHNRWTAADRAEVADYLIALWQQFRAQTVEP